MKAAGTCLAKVVLSWQGIRLSSLARKESRKPRHMNQSTAPLIGQGSGSAWQSICSATIQYVAHVAHRVRHSGSQKVMSCHVRETWTGRNKPCSADFEKIYRLLCLYSVLQDNEFPLRARCLPWKRWPAGDHQALKRQGEGTMASFCQLACKFMSRKSLLWHVEPDVRCRSDTPPQRSWRACTTDPKKFRSLHAIVAHLVTAATLCARVSSTTEVTSSNSLMSLRNQTSTKW